MGAIESLGISTTEEDKVKEIKKELEEYNEDVRELDEVKNLVSRLDLRESMAAKLLFGRVNKMLRRTDKLVEKLQIRKDRIDEELQAMELKDQTDEHKEQIVTIQEIIEAVNRLQMSPNQAKVDQIAQVKNVCIKYVFGDNSRSQLIFWSEFFALILLQSILNLAF